jgi:hypothetical protein
MLRDRLAAHEPTREQMTLGDRCKGTIYSCGVESDACDALTVLADSATVDDILDCRSRGCAGLGHCFASALTASLDPELGEQCSEVGGSARSK